MKAVALSHPKRVDHPVPDTRELPSQGGESFDSVLVQSVKVQDKGLQPREMGPRANADQALRSLSMGSVVNAQEAFAAYGRSNLAGSLFVDRVGAASHSAMGPRVTSAGHASNTLQPSGSLHSMGKSMPIVESPKPGFWQKLERFFTQGPASRGRGESEAQAGTSMKTPAASQSESNTGGGFFKSIGKFFASLGKTTEEYKKEKAPQCGAETVGSTARLGEVGKSVHSETVIGKIVHGHGAGLKSSSEEVPPAVSDSKGATEVGQEDTGPEKAHSGKATRSTSYRLRTSSFPVRELQPEDYEENRGTIMSAIHRAADKYDIPANLVAAVVKVESKFNPRAVSSDGARGLMQIAPATARSLQVRNVFDIHENLDGGCRYLKNMLDRFDGRVDLALAAYNAGPAAVERHGGIPPYRQTQRYVTKVLAHC